MKELLYNARKFFSATKNIIYYLCDEVTRSHWDELYAAGDRALNDTPKQKESGTLAHETHHKLNLEQRDGWWTSRRNLSLWDAIPIPVESFNLLADYRRHAYRRNGKLVRATIYALGPRRTRRRVWLVRFDHHEEIQHQAFLCETRANAFNFVDAVDTRVRHTIMLRKKNDFTINLVQQPVSPAFTNTNKEADHETA